MVILSKLMTNAPSLNCRRRIKNNNFTLDIQLEYGNIEVGTDIVNIKLKISTAHNGPKSAFAVFVPTDVGRLCVQG